MRKLNQSGSMLVPFILVFVLLLGAVGFGVWAYMGKLDYKYNSDAKSAVAVKKAVVVSDAKKEADFAQLLKSPVKSYKSPATFGSLAFEYPKTWSAFISETGTGNTPINGFFSPNYVPDVQYSGTSFALRIQVVNTPYSQMLRGYDSPVKTGKVTVAPFTAAKVPGTLGSIVSGVLDTSRASTNSVMVMMPVRDKTIQIWTEGPDYIEDFNKIVLPSFSFEP
jgi:hypothetical protein